MRTFFNTAGIIFIIVVLLTFALKNNGAVEITYYGIKQFFPLWSVILVPFFFGVIAGNLLDVIQRMKLKKEIRKLKREFKTMNPE